MAKRNTGCLTLGIIWAGLVTVYYVFMFDYTHKKFSWFDSIIAMTAVVVLVGGISTLSDRADKKGE